MSTQLKPLSHVEIAREIREEFGEDVTSHQVGLVRRNDMKSARVSALVERAVASLTAKVKASRKPRRTPKAKAAA